MKAEVLDLYNDLLEYCKERNLMITKFEIKNNVFNELDISIWSLVDGQMYYIKIPESNEIKCAFENKSKEYDFELQDIIDMYIY